MLRLRSSRGLAGRPARWMALLALISAIITPMLAHATVQPMLPGFPPQNLAGQRINAGSVTLGQLDADTRLEIVVGGSDGWIYALEHTGAVKWQVNITGAINATAGAVGLNPAGGPVPIRSAPAIADLDNNGQNEVIVSAGDIFGPKVHGAVVVLNGASGSMLPGWPQLGIDHGGAGADQGAPDGFADGIVSTPAVMDITGDGLPEIVYGGFDQRVYARRADGHHLPGFPKFVLDTVWSSPAIADIDGNGTRDIVIGVDAHDFNDLQGLQTFKGGDLYVISADGHIQWTAHQDEIFQSSPAIADLDNDGQPEIVAGTGDYYATTENPAVGRYITAWNHDGSVLWRRAMPTQVLGSPAIADLNLDGILDVVVGAKDQKIYALHGHTGGQIWAVTPRDIFNTPNNVGSPVLGDYDGDGDDDVFINVGWDVVVLDGRSGGQFTSTAGPGDASKPSFYGRYLINGTPAIGDLDADGNLELVAAAADNSGARAEVFAWNLPLSTNTLASWPMFHRGAQHSGLFSRAVIHTAPRRIDTLLQRSTTTSYQISVGSPTGPLSWTASESDPSGIVTLGQASGGTPGSLSLTLRAPSTAGLYSATITLNAPGATPVSIPITVRSVTTRHVRLMPLVRR